MALVGLVRLVDSAVVAWSGSGGVGDGTRVCRGGGTCAA